MHPLVYTGPRMVKPPVVQLAGMLRAVGRYIDSDVWIWQSNMAGQLLFYPPNVSGWDATRWLNTGTWLARFNLAASVIGEQRALVPAVARGAVPSEAQALLEEASAFWGAPPLSEATRRALLAYAQAAVASGMLRTQLAPFQLPGGAAPALPAGYPVSSDQFPARLAGVAQLLGAGMPISCATVSTESVFDTHSGQVGALDGALGGAVQALYAFQRDLEARGLADRVLTLVWSEFGRRAHENASAGTDHGAGGCAFVMGAQAAGAMVGEWPGLARGLDGEGNLKATSDFRGLYCSLLEQWLGQDAAAVIPGAGRLARVRVVG